jgi:hypothetical protein
VRKLRGAVRAGYRLGPKITLFGEGAVNELSYEKTTGEPRGSWGYSILAGARFDLSDLSHAEAAVGYFHQSYDNPADGNIGGLDYYLSLHWTPTPRLELTASGSRSVERSPLTEVSAVVESDLRAGALYALGGKLLAGLEAGYVRQKYTSIDRSEQRFFAEASLRYRINPKLSAVGAVGYRDQTAKGVGGREYSGVSARIGLRWTP